jgi:hypothetical protein
VNPKDSPPPRAQKQILRTLGVEENRLFPRNQGVYANFTWLSCVAACYPWGKQAVFHEMDAQFENENAF